MNAQIDSMRRAEAPRVAVVAYTEYPWDSRVRREAEGLVEDGYIVHAIVARPRSGPSATHIGDTNAVCMRRFPENRNHGIVPEPGIQREGTIPHQVRSGSASQPGP